jgi:hypothetical protein
VEFLHLRLHDLDLRTTLERFKDCDDKAWF